MNRQPEKTTFRVDEASRAYFIIMLLLVGLTAASAAIHHAIVTKQTGFLDALIIRFAQACTEETLQQDMATLIAPGKESIRILTYASYGVYCAIFILVVYAALALFFPAISHIRTQRKQLERMASSDLLTGLYSRAALFKVASMLMNGAKRHKQDLTILAVDIDAFRKINDAKGRAAGDAAIKAVSGALTEVLRTSDAVGRIGGDVFAVFLPSTNEYSATHVAEKLRKAVEEIPFEAGFRTFLLRVSIGLAQMQPHHNSPDDMLRAAELALSHAKNAGGNRVVTYSSIPDASAAKPAVEGADKI